MRQDVLGEPRPLEFFSSGLDLDALRSEIFFLAYHLHWSWGDLMALDTAERQAYVRLLVEQIERENARLAEVRRG